MTGVSLGTGIRSIPRLDPERRELHNHLESMPDAERIFLPPTRVDAMTSKVAARRHDPRCLPPERRTLPPSSSPAIGVGSGRRAHCGNAGVMRARIGASPGHSGPVRTTVPPGSWWG